MAGTKIVRGKKNEVIEQTQHAEILEKVSKLTPTNILDNVNKVGLNAQKVLADVGTQINGFLIQRDEAEAAVALIQARLKELHGIETAAISLDDLQAQLVAQREQLDNERDAFDLEMEQLRSETETSRKKDEAEWTYKVKTEHAQKLDTLTQEILKVQREEKLRAEAQKRDHDQREAALKAREQELIDLRAVMALVPEQTKKEVEKQVSIVTNVLKRDHDLNIKLLTNEKETAAKISSQEKAACEAKVAHLEGLLASRDQALAEAHRQVSEIAKDAFQSVSGQAALSAVAQTVAAKDGSQQGGRR